MKTQAVQLAVAVLIFLGAAGPQPLGSREGLELAAGKNCRLVDMCWYKDGKRHCFKKLVCD